MGYDWKFGSSKCSLKRQPWVSQNLACLGILYSHFSCIHWMGFVDHQHRFFALPKRSDFGQFSIHLGERWREGLLSTARDDLPVNLLLLARHRPALSDDSTDLGVCDSLCKFGGYTHLSNSDSCVYAGLWCPPAPFSPGWVCSLADLHLANPFVPKTLRSSVWEQVIRRS